MAPRTYAPPWMYNASGVWRDPSLTFLRDLRPEVLRLDLRLLELPLGEISGPPRLWPMAKPRVFNTFNPSIVRAPRSLCPRCRYVVAMRADPLHQCDANSPLIPVCAARPVPVRCA